MQDNISGFVQELVRAKILPVPLNFGALQDVFTYLNALPEKIIVVIDEYPYLKAMNDSATVDSIFQNIIDNRLANIELILYRLPYWYRMKDTLQEKNALYGRFAVTYQAQRARTIWKLQNSIQTRRPMTKRRTMPFLVDRHLSIRR